MLLLDVRRDGSEPIYKQIHDQVIRLVDDGTLPPGTHLPPTRVLAANLGVNRTTVCRAYQELWALGYLESRPGSYSTVRGRLKPLATGAAVAGPSSIDWKAASAPASRRAYEDYLRLPRAAATSARRTDVIRFDGLAADRGLCPAADFRRAVRHVLAEHGTRLLDYGDPAGYAPLRDAIARRMRTHGVTVTADEILVTNGAQHALDLVARLLAGRDAPVVVESPTYSMAIPLLRLHGASLRAVPLRADGLDLDLLEAQLSAQRCAFVYTMPSFHNPTGISTDQAHRERLLAMCERHRVPLVEDGFEEEMKYFGKAVLPIKSMDANGTVIYLGTFSKVVFPGLRIGWIAAQRACIERLLALSRITALSGNMLGQAAVARFCEGGRYEATLRRIHGAYKQRMQTALRALKEHMPERGVEWTQPAGGYTLLVRLPGAEVAESRLIERLEEAGVRVHPGALFYPAGSDAPGFRLSISNLTEPEIVEGCRRLGAALRRFLEA